MLLRQLDSQPCCDSRNLNAQKGEMDLGLGWWELPEHENYQAGPGLAVKKREILDDSVES